MPNIIAFSSLKVSIIIMSFKVDNYSPSGAAGNDDEDDDDEYEEIKQGAFMYIIFACVDLLSCCKL